MTVEFYSSERILRIEAVLVRWDPKGFPPSPSVWDKSFHYPSRRRVLVNQRGFTGNTLTDTAE
jgi:hypothetical protein